MPLSLPTGLPIEGVEMPVLPTDSAMGVIVVLRPRVRIVNVVLRVVLVFHELTLTAQDLTHQVYAAALEYASALQGFDSGHQHGAQTPCRKLADFRDAKLRQINRPRRWSKLPTTVQSLRQDFSDSLYPMQKSEAARLPWPASKATLAALHGVGCSSLLLGCAGVL